MVKVGHADEVVNRLTSRASRAAPSCRAFLIGPPHHQTFLSTRQYGPHHPLRPAVHVQVFLVMPGARGAQRYFLSPQQSTAHGCVHAKLSRLHGNRAHADFRCGVIEGSTDVIGCRVCDDVSCCVAWRQRAARHSADQRGQGSDEEDGGDHGVLWTGLKKKVDDLDSNSDVSKKMRNRDDDVITFIVIIYIVAVVIVVLMW